MSQELFPHIDHALVPKPHPPMYLMHKFWARKPHNVVAEYIRHYSKKDEIVLDPFCGSGVTAIEALKNKRKTVTIDLNPISTFMTRMTLLPINLENYLKAYERIKENIGKSIESLYETKCPKCGKKAVAICIRWKKGTPSEMRNLLCSSCGMIRNKKLDEQD